MSDKIQPQDTLDELCCFPIAALARLLVRRQQPFLESLGLTYPQYLVLLTLQGQAPLSVREIGRRLVLNTNTLTPLLKRMESAGYISRTRSKDDERVLFVELTEQGKDMARQCMAVQASFQQEEPELFEALSQIRPDIDRALAYTSRSVM